MEINTKETRAIINALTTGVVPRIGLRHIAVGRDKEISTFLNDLQGVEEGSSAFRIVSGRYGSGKSFLLQTIRTNAIERSFIVCDADMSPERRMTGSSGQGLATYTELISNLSTKTRQDGGALESIIQKWITRIEKDVDNEYPTYSQEKKIERIRWKIQSNLENVSELAYGFSFIKVIELYWKALQTGDEYLKRSVLKWLRGEYTNKLAARQDLGVDRIIDDTTWYDFLKLFAFFVHDIGYKGLLVFLDEGVNLYKISNKQSRNSNYEKILTILNDTMQGKAQYIGVFISGTEQFIYDEERGLFSYDALRTRLKDTSFAGNIVDYNQPIIKLSIISNEEIYILLERLVEIHGEHFKYKHSIEQEEIISFLNIVNSKLGANKFLTPREVTRDFIGVLNILQQNPEKNFYELINRDDFKITIEKEDPDQIDLYADFEL